MPDVSIIVVTWNARELLGRCLAALSPFAHETLLIDNVSTDGSPEYVALAFPEIALVRAPLNLGFAGAVNFASRRLAGEFLLLLNPDMVARAGAVDRLASFLEANPDCGAVAGRVEEGGTGSVRRLPTLATMARDLLLLDKLPAFRPIARPWWPPGADWRDPVDVELPSTGCLMVRRAAFEAVGRMDEAFYPAWFEDADFCRRLRRRGWRIVVHPAAIFDRAVSGRTRRLLGYDTFTRIWYRNLQRYTRKHYGLAALALIKALIVAGALERIAITLARGNRQSAAAFWRVLCDVLRPRGYAKLVDQLAGEPDAAAGRSAASHPR